MGTISCFNQLTRLRFVICVTLTTLSGHAVLGQQFVEPKAPPLESGRCTSPESAAAGQRARPCDHEAIAELARTGRAFAENQMGIESALVLSPNRTVRDARQWFERAAAQGYAPAQVNLGVLYLNGWGTPRNYGAALYWLRSAAERGEPRAHTNLGILYLNGWGVRQDYAEALKYFDFATNHGETGAMVNLGYMSDGGLGTPKDQATAAKWYLQAAERGDSLGQNNLADLYLRGEGVQQSDAFAFDWFQKAALQGHTGACIKLGFLYMTGRGTEKNLESAYTWLLAAVLAGDPRGREYLRALEGQLSAEQQARARERAEALHAARDRAIPETAFLQ